MSLAANTTKHIDALQPTFLINNLVTATFQNEHDFKVNKLDVLTIPVYGK